MTYAGRHFKEMANKSAGKARDAKRASTGKDKPRKRYGKGGRNGQA